MKFTNKTDDEVDRTNGKEQQGEILVRKEEWEMYERDRTNGDESTINKELEWKKWTRKHIR